MLRCLIVSGFILVLGQNAFSQGCSDAGFCTMGAMKPDQPFNKKIEFKLRTMEVSFYRGTTTMTPIIFVATADLGFYINRRTSLQVKLPYQAVTGRLADTQGMGDISLCLTKTLHSSESGDLNVSLGTKIPTNNSSLSVNNRPLPMYYQTSLGTYDVISGISYITRKWLFATGIQIPLNENENQFLWGAWKGSEHEEYVLGYDRAKELKRGIDVMLRVERNFRYSRFNFSLGLLPIYRVTRDEFTLPNGERTRPEEAQGLALSGIFTTGYSFSVSSGVKLLIGHKIVQRDENPDGLTRELVLSLGYFHRF